MTDREKQVTRPPVYLDWNATTPMAREVLEAMTEARSNAWANPASVHSAGRAARAVLEDCRDIAASHLGVHARDVCFTSGGTEANNLALHAAASLVLSRLDHPSVTKVAERLEAEGKPVQWLNVPESGRLEPEDLRRVLADCVRGTTVAISAVNHETGVLQPVQEVLAVARELGARVHVDAVQAVGKVPPELYLGAHSIAATAHKIRGPKGIGLLGWTGPPPTPLLRGGAQERGIRPGTQDAVLAAGFAAALARSRQGPERYATLESLRDGLELRLAGLVRVNGDARRAPHVSNLAVEGWAADELVAALDLQGVLISGGSACSAGTSEASPVITAMRGEARARRSIRLSLGETTTGEEIDQAVQRIEAVLARRPRTSCKA